jgi:hypothetical protein
MSAEAQVKPLPKAARQIKFTRFKLSLLPGLAHGYWDGGRGGIAVFHDVVEDTDGHLSIPNFLLNVLADSQIGLVGYQGGQCFMVVQSVGLQGLLYHFNKTLPRHV